MLSLWAVTHADTYHGTTKPGTHTVWQKEHFRGEGHPVQQSYKWQCGERVFTVSQWLLHVLLLLWPQILDRLFICFEQMRKNYWYQKSDIHLKRDGNVHNMNVVHDAIRTVFVWMVKPSEAFQRSFLVHKMFFRL